MLRTYILAILLYSTGFTALAQSDILDKKVSLNFENTSIEKILNKISSEYQLRFSYSRKLVNLDKIISINADNQPLSYVLEQILNNSGIDFRLIGSQIVLLNSDDHKNGLPQANPQPKKTVEENYKTTNNQKADSVVTDTNLMKKDTVDIDSIIIIPLSPDTSKKEPGINRPKRNSGLNFSNGFVSSDLTNKSGILFRLEGIYRSVGISASLTYFSWPKTSQDTFQSSPLSYNYNINYYFHISKLKQLSVYPIAGINFTDEVKVNSPSDTVTNILNYNLGAGIKYMLFKKLSLFGEYKHLFGKLSRSVYTLGLSFRFNSF